MKNIEPKWDWLWNSEMAYIDCTPKQYRDWLLRTATPILVRGYARELDYKKIGPGVIRVFKKPIDGKCQYCGHAPSSSSPAKGGGL